MRDAVLVQGSTNNQQDVNPLEKAENYVKILTQYNPKIKDNCLRLKREDIWH
jgi:hypothetical protein